MLCVWFLSQLGGCLSFLSPVLFCILLACSPQVCESILLSKQWDVLSLPQAWNAKSFSDNSSFPFSGEWDVQSMHWVKRPLKHCLILLSWYAAGFIWSHLISVLSLPFPIDSFQFWIFMILTWFKVQPVWYQSITSSSPPLFPIQ